MSPGPPEPRTEGTIVLRIWVEPHDGLVRARMFSGTGDEGLPLIGVEQILEAVAVAVRGYAVSNG